MKKLFLIAILGAVFTSASNAQEGLPSRSMTIEGAYNPTVTKTEKIMPVPDKPVTETKTAQVSYLTDTNPLQNLQRNPMGAFSENSDDVIPASYTGLVRFGYGLRNVHDGLLDFDWNISERDELKVWGILDGWATKPSDDWKSRMFNGDLTAVYTHRFDAFTIDIDGAIGHSHFNYRRGVNMDDIKYQNSSLMQSTGRERLGAALRGDAYDLKWHAGAGMEWLSRDGLELNGVSRDNKERLLRIEGGFSMPILGGTGGMEYRQKSAIYDWQGINGCDYSNFTTLTFTPYWKQSWGDVDADLGFNIDIRTAAGYKFLMSPMATLTYKSRENLKLQAGLTGGLVDNSMRSLSRISPYWSEEKRIRDGYTVVDLSFGASYWQGTWLTLSGKAGYRYSIDEVFQTVDDSLIVTSILKQQTSNLFYVRLDAAMQFSDRASVNMDITYNNYLGLYIGHKMDLKPAFDTNVFGTLKIIDGLDAMLSYRMMLFHKVNGTAMPAVNDLSLTFDYDFRPNLSLFLTGSRLVGGDWYYYAGYRAIKPSVIIGATYRF